MKVPGFNNLKWFRANTERVHPKPCEVTKIPVLMEGKAEYIRRFMAELDQEVNSLNRLRKELLHDSDEYELDEVAERIKRLKENDFNRQKNGLLANDFCKHKPLFDICNIQGYYPEVPIHTISQLKDMNNATLIGYLRFYQLKNYEDNVVLNKVKLLAWVGIMEYGVFQ